MTCLAVLFGIAGLVAADPPAVYSGVDQQLQVQVPRLEAEVSVDGVLDEPVWQQVPTLTGFSQYAPSDGRPAGEQTEILVWYTSSALHFGIRARAAPGTVRATLSSRDRIGNDDQILLFLSPFNDGRQALMFGVNPLGVQADGTLVEGLSTGHGFTGLQSGREAADLSPDFVFQSKGRLTPDGYEIEVRIPFKSVRSPAADPQTWGIHVVRVSRGSGHEDSWVPAKRAATSFLAQAGALEGLTGIGRGLVLDLNPIVTARVDGAPGESSWAYDAQRPEFGGNIRWGVTPNLTLNGTVNPDFAEVEADAGQFVFDPRQALYYPEKRPFFLDGIEQFSMPNRLIYTRRVVAPLVAGKLNGKIGGTTMAVLSAVDDMSTSASGSDHPLFVIARVQRDVGRESKMAFVFTDREDGDAYNRVAGADARLTFSQLYTLQLQGAASWTKRGDGAVAAPLWEAVFSRNGRAFGWRYTLTGIHDDFKAASGFISRAGVVRLNLDHRYTIYGEKGRWLERWSNDVVLDGSWQYQDFVRGREAQDQKLHLNSNATLRGGWNVGGSVLIETFGYDEHLYEDYRLGQVRPDGSYVYLPFTGTPRLYNFDWLVSVNTPQFKTFSANAFVIWGRDENFYEWSPADIVYAQYGLDWRPTEQVRVNAGYQLQQFRRRTDGSLVGRRQIPRLKLEYQLSRSIFFRFVGEYDAYMQDDLRDDSRTDLPVFFYDAAADTHERALGSTTNRFRADWLFSYQPVPGTVVFAGYGSTMSEPGSLRFNALSRVRDGFFLKVSYLFRL